MQLILSLSLCLAAFSAHAAKATVQTPTAVVAVGTEIKILTPIEVSKDGLVNLDSFPAPGVMLQRAMQVRFQQVTGESLSRGYCMIMPVATVSSDFTIVPQVVTFASVTGQTAAHALVLDQKGQHQPVQIECDCSNDQGTVLTPRCLKLAFQRLSHASFLELEPQPSLRGDDIKTEVMTVRTVEAK